MSRPTLSVLVVGPRVDGFAAALASHGALAATPAPTFDAAIAYLDATTFDVVLVQDAWADRLRNVVHKRGLPSSVLPFSEDGADPPAWAARLLGETGAPTGDDAREALEAIRDEIGRVVHALNNPLAVIVGNAQLAQELARAVETDPTIAVAIDDIAHAGEELGRLFDRVRDLRSRVDAVLRAS